MKLSASLNVTEKILNNTRCELDLEFIVGYYILMPQAVVHHEVAYRNYSPENIQELINR